MRRPSRLSLGKQLPPELSDDPWPQWRQEHRAFVEALRRAGVKEITRTDAGTERPGIASGPVEVRSNGWDV